MNSYRGIYCVSLKNAHFASVAYFLQENHLYHIANSCFNSITISYFENEMLDSGFFFMIHLFSVICE